MSVNEEKKQFPFQIGLNERERKRFANLFMELSKHSIDMRIALEKGDDVEIYMNFVMFRMTLHSIQELSEILAEVVKNKLKEKKPDFPEFIKNI